MRRAVKLMSLVLVLAFVVSTVLTGCGKKGTEVNEASTSADQTKPKGDPVEITFYIKNSPLKDFERIMEAVNKKTLEKINATLKIVITPSADYAQKMNLMIASAESFDLCFTASSGNLGYFQNAAKGAYKDLTQMLPQYAPQSKARVPEKLWQGITVNGKIYGVINYQMWGVSKAYGVIIRKDIADKSNFDWKNMKKLEDLTPYLEAVKKSDPDSVPFEYVGGNGSDSFTAPLYGMDNVGDANTPGCVKLDDKDMKVINQYESAEYKSYLKMMRDWYLKEYIRSDAATLKDALPDRKAKRIGASISQGYPDSADMPELADSNPDKNLTWMPNTNNGDSKDQVAAYMKRLMEPYTPANSPSAAITAVGANSKNPERALQMVELLNTDDDLYRTIAYGQEGIDYNWNATTGNADFVKDMYTFNWNEWQIGQSYSPTFTRNLTNRKEAGEVQKKQMNIIYQGDKNGKVSPIMGFVFDVEPVKTQVANCSSVIKEMTPSLGSGMADLDQYLPQFLDRLKKAGVDDIIKEKQKQVDAWRKANGK